MSPITCHFKSERNACDGDIQDCYIEKIEDSGLEIAAPNSALKVGDFEMHVGQT